MSGDYDAFSCYEDTMRTLITGGSGLLATNWAIHVRKKYPLFLATHRHSVSLAGVESGHVRLDDQGAISQVIHAFKPDLIIHTAGLTNVDECERNPGLAKKVNSDIAANVARAAVGADVTLVHISTDHLFQGDKANLDEQAVPSPVNVYGRTKLEAEKAVAAICPEALIVRTNFFGWGAHGRSSITDWIINSLRGGERIHAFEDVFITPVYVDTLVDIIYKLVELNVSGIINVVSDERVSKFDFALAVAEEFGLNKELVLRGKLSDVSLDAERPHDMSLSNVKATGLIGESLGTIKSELRKLKASSDRIAMLNQMFGDRVG